MRPEKTSLRRKSEFGYLRWVVDYPYGKAIFRDHDKALKFAIRITTAYVK